MPLSQVTTRFPIRLVLALMLLVSIVSCKTTKTVPAEIIKTIVNHDSLIMNHQLYDSIIIQNDHFIDRSQDTVYVHDKQLQYHYKLLRDTIYKSKIDSIPVIKTVEVTKEVKGTCTEQSRSTPWYVKALAWIGAICLLLIVIFVAIKLTKY